MDGGIKAVERAKPRAGAGVAGLRRADEPPADAMESEKAADLALAGGRASERVPLRYAQALTPAVSGTAIMTGTLLLIQLWVPVVAGAHFILVVSALAGAVSYGAVAHATAPKQHRALWRRLAQRMPAHGARP